MPTAWAGHVGRMARECCTAAQRYRYLLKKTFFNTGFLMFFKIDLVDNMFNCFLLLNINFLLVFIVFKILPNLPSAPVTKIFFIMK